jgi:DNA-binding NarL/FixJ family response regulator
VKTVASNLSRIYRKLQVTNRTELASKFPTTTADQEDPSR